MVALLSRTFVRLRTGRSTLRAWLYRIAINACLDFLARNPRQPRPFQVPPAADPGFPAKPPTEIHGCSRIRTVFWTRPRAAGIREGDLCRIRSSQLASTSQKVRSRGIGQCGVRGCGVEQHGRRVLGVQSRFR